MAFHQVDEYVWWRLSLSSPVGKWDRPSAFQAPELSERRTWQQKSEQSLPRHHGYQGDLRKQFWKLSGVSSLPPSETLCKVLCISFLVLKMPMFQLFPALTKLREQYRYKCQWKNMAAGEVYRANFQLFWQNSLVHSFRSGKQSAY